jgi:NADPH-dependent 2,4-dienoyl-CoA reductase/sulfur reductase-like enzyme
MLEWIEVTNGRRRIRIACDLLATGYGLVPNTELAQLLGCRLKHDGVDVDESQQTSIPGVFAAGELTGIGGAELSLIEGAIAGYSASLQLGRGTIHAMRMLLAQRSRYQAFACAMDTAFALREELHQAVTAETIVCRCEDVRAGRLRGYGSWREAKLHSRCGMGPCQGRVCGSATEFFLGWRAEGVRPPGVPVRLSALAENDEE